MPSFVSIGRKDRAHVMAILYALPMLEHFSLLLPEVPLPPTKNMIFWALLLHLLSLPLYAIELIKSTKTIDLIREEEISMLSFLLLL